MTTHSSPTRRSFIKGVTAGGAVVMLGWDPIAGTFREAHAGDASKPDAWKMSVCPYCGVGCGIEVGVTKKKVVAVRGMKDHPVNKGAVCLLGKNLLEIIETNDRLTHPMIRSASGKSFKKVSWNNANDHVAAKIKAITDKHGPDAFAMYVSASEYLEEYYVYNKFVKGCLGTNNLESSARLCWASGVVGLVKAFGADAPPCAYDDLDSSNLFLVAGYNPASSKPVFFRRMMMARHKNKTPLIVIDPRKTDTAAFANLHLQINPGTDVVLHNTLAHILIKEKLIDENEARALTNNFDELKKHVSDASPEAAAKITGLKKEDILKAARMIGKAGKAIFMWGQGLNQSRIGTRKVTTLLNLVFITGNIGKPGAGPMAITGQCGAMSLREVGALPHLLPGFRLVTDAKARDDIAQIWGVDPATMSPNKGLSIPKILQAAERGKLKALWIIHSNPAATFPDTNWVRQVLSKLDFLVVQDCYHPTETSTYAHVLLPGAQWPEKEGVVTNSERGMNLAEKAINPPGESKPDLEIVMDVARRMGFKKQFPYTNTEQIFEEFKRCTENRPCDMRGLTYQRIRKEKGIQWPVPTAKHKGTKRRFLDGSFPKGKLSLNLYDHAPPGEQPDKRYPLLLITGLVSMQYHSRTRTGKVAALNKALPEPFVEVHPVDAKKAHVSEGQIIQLASRRGAIKARARLTMDVKKGTVFVPYHFGFLAGKNVAVNSLTNRSFDEFAGQPEYKACAVKITKA